MVDLEDQGSSAWGGCGVVHLLRSERPREARAREAVQRLGIRDPAHDGVNIGVGPLADPVHPITVFVASRGFEPSVDGPASSGSAGTRGSCGTD